MGFQLQSQLSAGHGIHPNSVLLRHLSSDRAPAPKNSINGRSLALILFGFFIGAFTTMTDMRISVSTGSNEDSQPRWKQGLEKATNITQRLRKADYANKKAMLQVSENIERVNVNGLTAVGCE